MKCTNQDIFKRSCALREHIFKCTIFKKVIYLVKYYRYVILLAIPQKRNKNRQISFLLFSIVLVINLTFLVTYYAITVNPELSFEYLKKTSQLSKIQFFIKKYE